MNVVKCSNSKEPHFYDGEKYDKCPHCGAAPLGTNGKDEKRGPISIISRKKDTMAIVGENTSSGQEGKTFGLFSKAKLKDNSNSDGVKLSGEGDEANGNMNNENMLLQSSTNAVIDNVSNENNDDKKYLETSTVNKEYTYGSKTVSAYQVASNPLLHGYKTPTIQPKINEVDATKETAAVNYVQAPQSISGETDNSGKTQGFFSIKTPTTAQSGAHVAPASLEASFVENTEPCAGWLVCVKGMYFGRNLPIYAGRNSVGREESNRICLRGDMSVSREKHSWIMYEPKKREFYVQPGEGSGLTYLNDENVLGTEKLNAYDKIEIGEGVYMFVPLCGEKFTWEDYMGRDK